MIKANGAGYTGNLDKTCTHLVVSQPAGRKYLAARRWELHIVAKQWVEDSVKRGMILDEACYDPHLPAQDIGKGACTRTTLRRKSLGKRLREAVEGQTDGGRRKLRKTASMKLSSQRENMWGEILGQQPSLDQSAAALQDQEPTQPLPIDSNLRRPLEPTTRVGEVADSLGGMDHRGDEVFASCSFYLFEFPPGHIEVIVPFITSRGGTIVQSLEGLNPPQNASRRFVIVPQQSHPQSHPLVPEGVEIITEFFIEKCVYKKGTTLPDPRAHVIGRPFPAFPIQGFSKLSISTSGFVDIELNQIAKVVGQLGARYEERFTAQCSMLVCTSWSGARKQKLQLALSWGVPVVKAEWLWECISRGERLPIEAFVFAEAKTRAADRAQLAKPLSRSKSVPDMLKKFTPKTLTGRTESTSRASFPGPDMSAFDTTSLVATEPPRSVSRGKTSTKDSNTASEFETAPSHQSKQKSGSQQLPSRPGSRNGTNALTEKSANELNKVSREKPPSQPSRKPLDRVRSEVCDSEAGDDDALDFTGDDDHDTAPDTMTVAEDAIETKKRRREKQKAEKAAAERRALSTKLTSLLEGTAATNGDHSFESSVSGVRADSAAQQPPPTAIRRKRKIMGRVVSNASAASNGSEDSSTGGVAGARGRTHPTVLHEGDSSGEEEQPAAAGPTATQIQYDDPEAAKSKQRLMSRMLGRGSLGASSAKSSGNGDRITMAALQEASGGRSMRRR